MVSLLQLNVTRNSGQMANSSDKYVAQFQRILGKCLRGGLVKDAKFLQASGQLSEAFAAGQQDAAEFLQALLERFESTKLGAIFEACQRIEDTRFSCLVCPDSTWSKRIRDHKPLIMTVPLRDQREQQTLLSALEDYFEPVVPDEHNCPTCRSGQFSVEQRLVPRLAPEVLTIQLKRMRVTFDKRKRATARKLHTPVLVSRALTYHDATYSLRSIILHEGESVQSGHYRAFGEWLAIQGSVLISVLAVLHADGSATLYDDATSEHVDSAAQELQSPEMMKQAYLLFYAKTGSINKVTMFRLIPVTKCSEFAQQTAESKSENKSASAKAAPAASAHSSALQSSTRSNAGSSPAASQPARTRRANSVSGKENKR